MHPCHKPSRSAPRMRRHDCRRLDLDTMHRPRARPSGCRRLGAVIRFAVSVGTSLPLARCARACCSSASKAASASRAASSASPIVGLMWYRPRINGIFPPRPSLRISRHKWQSRSFLATSRSSLATAFFADSNSNIRLICCQDRRRSGAVTRAPPSPIAARSTRALRYPAPKGELRGRAGVRGGYAWRFSAACWNVCRNRRDARNSKNRIQQRPILCAQWRSDFVFQRAPVARRRNSPPHFPNGHSSSWVTETGRTALECFEWA